MTLNTALDACAGDHLDAAIALNAIVREYAKTVGYRQVGKVIAHLDLPQ